MFYFKLVPILFAAFILSGCSSNKKNEQPEAVSNIIVETTNIEQLQSIISERNDKILFLNIWATWCIPCIEEFPAIVKLSEYYSNKDVEFIAVSIDYPEEAETKIIPFLESQNVKFKVLVKEYGNDEEFINGLNIEWNGAIPATFIYSKEGEKKSFLTGEHTYEDFFSEIENVRD